uniref:39S ribosomal protein L54, mitochondrial n=1 Tax=Parastrongyloides trichosuri TaxID=131310 RepID=A0A0N5A562_PARTI
MNQLLKLTCSNIPKIINISFRAVSTSNIFLGPKVAAFKVDKSFVETDGEKLSKYVCINYFTEIKEPGPEILPDDQYPLWLFELDLSPPKEFEDMDPDVDGWKYYRELAKRNCEQRRRIKKLKTKFLHIQNSPSLRQMDGNTKRPKFLRKSHPDNC